MSSNRLLNKLDFDKKQVMFLLLGIVFGVSATVFAPQLTGEGERAAQSLVSFLENQTGQELEVVNVKSDSGIYRVQVSNSENQLSTYHVSKNGDMYTSNMINIEEMKESLNALRKFRTCLQNSGVTMYGNATQRTTQAQIQQLGGAQIVAPIYKDVQNNQTLREALQLGVERVPAFYDGNSSIEGIQTVEQVESFTGCSFPQN